MKSKNQEKNDQDSGNKEMIRMIAIFNDSSRQGYTLTHRHAEKHTHTILLWTETTKQKKTNQIFLCYSQLDDNNNDNDEKFYSRYNEAIPTYPITVNTVSYK